MPSTSAHCAQPTPRNPSIRHARPRPPNDDGCHRISRAMSIRPSLVRREDEHTGGVHDRHRHHGLRSPTRHAHTTDQPELSSLETMMSLQYAILIYESPSDRAIREADGPEQAEVSAAYAAYTQTLVEAGVMRSGEALELPHTATTLIGMGSGVCGHDPRRTLRRHQRTTWGCLPDRSRQPG